MLYLTTPQDLPCGILRAQSGVFPAVLKSPGSLKLANFFIS